MKIPSLLLTVLCTILTSTAVAAEDLGITALTEAQQQNKFLLVLVTSSADEQEQLLTLRKSVENGVAENTQKLMSAEVNVEDKASQGFIRKYGLRYAPKPLVLVVAPNGAITGSFTSKFAPEKLLAQLPSPKMQTCIKHLQDRKLVLISIHNNTTAETKEALMGINAFATDTLHQPYTVTVFIDPADPVEANTVKQLGIAANPSKATSILLVPPGKILGKWEGSVRKEDFSNVLSQLKNSGSCGTSSCADPNCP